MSFDLPVYIFDLAGMTNDDLVRSWDEMMSNTPCIALIEDIDNIFDGRQYVGSTNPNIPHLTFDCLLNCISGVKQADGVFLIVTTNHLEKLDPAIGIPDTNGKSTRPGRIDKALHLGLMAEEQRLMLAKHILSDYPELVDETVKLGEGETAAQFQARCAHLALSKFWEEGKVIAKDSYEEVMHFQNLKLHKRDANAPYGRLGKPPSPPSSDEMPRKPYTIEKL
jgi:SpoVK/Ycf46/Vps4 family AAA+-type ATPase